MATLYGELANELVYAPKSTVEPVLAILQYCFSKLDRASVSSPTVPAILFVARVAVRLELWMSWTLSHEALWTPLLDPQRNALMQLHANLRRLLTSEICQVLLGWVAEAVVKDITFLPLLHSHLVLILGHAAISGESMDPLVCSHLLSSLFFVISTQEPLRIAPGERLEDATAEFYAMFHRIRAPVCRYMAGLRHADLDFVLSAVLSSLTGDSPTHGWASVPDMAGEYLNDQVQVNLLVARVTYCSSRIGPAPAILTSLGGFKHLFGDTNMQVSTVSTYQACLHLKLVGTAFEAMIWDPNDRGIEGFRLPRGSPRILCMEPSPQLVYRGQHYEMPYHAAYSEKELLPQLRESALREDAKSGLPEWVRPVLDPALLHLFSKVKTDKLCFEELFVLTRPRVIPSDATEVTLLAVARDPVVHVLEFIVDRDPAAVQVFQLIEHARRTYRQLIWTTDSTRSLSGSLLKNTENLLDAKQCWGVTPTTRFIAGALDARSGLTFKKSVELMHLDPTDSSRWTWMPSAVLDGIVPGVLLTDYSFWQKQTGPNQPDPEPESGAEF